MQPKRNILMLASDYLPPKSGVGRYVAQLSESLRPQWNVIVSAPGATSSNGTIRDNHLPSTGPSSFSIARLIEWTAVMSALGAGSQQPDLIHAHGFMSAVAAQILSELYQVPWILTKHCWLEKYDNAPDIAFTLQRWAIENCAVTVAPSHWLATRIEKDCSPKSRPQVIYGDSHVPDLHEFTKNERRTHAGRLFVHTGMQYHKGADITVRLFQEYAQPEDRLILIGGIEDRLGDLIEEASRDPRITVKGHLSDRSAWQYYYSADAMLAPSRSEGLPLAVIEAQKLGCPVLTTLQTSICEIVTDSVTGVCARDEIALGSAIDQFNPESDFDRDTIASLSRNRFSWHRTSEQYSSLYSSLI